MLELTLILILLAVAFLLFGRKRATAKRDDAAEAARRAVEAQLDPSDDKDSRA
ncbi:hypothetical protein [Maricaulis sp.]|uniref:hypothetical protein n=1 Tax=Maricaulis sp. TaxID=1486257 RepID=UPI002624EE3F|nr:hypothetical protein [Maricaulis sp.]